jgi:hypothetical protein
MFSDSRRNKAEIIEITPEILDEKVETIKKSKSQKRSFEQEVRLRFGFLWLAVVSYIWLSFNLIEILFRAVRCSVFFFFSNKQENQKFFSVFQAALVSIGLVIGCLIAVILPALGRIIIRFFDRYGSRLNRASYGILRMLFARHL